MTKYFGSGGGVTLHGRARWCDWRISRNLRVLAQNISWLKRPRPRYECEAPQHLVSKDLSLQKIGHRLYWSTVNDADVIAMFLNLYSLCGMYGMVIRRYIVIPTTVLAV